VKRDELLYVDHIAESIDLILEWTAGGKTGFLADRRSQAAVMRTLQTLAESAKRLSPALKERYPDVPWREIIGIRNVLVHDYLAVNLNIIWSIVEERLPQLRQQMAQILVAEATSSGP
jgi:uncharacterized protein with HEPN domain